MKELWERLVRAPMGLGLGFGLTVQRGPLEPPELSEWTWDTTAFTLDSAAYTYDGSAP